MSQLNMSRRGFVKAAAATGALAAFGATAVDGATFREAHADETTSQTKKVYTSCQACICSCAVIATVRDGRVIRLEGNPESPISRGGLCAKGLSGIQALYNPCRNKYPMKRVGERGTNSFERISWDQAIEEIAQKLTQDFFKYGGESLVTSTGGGGNPHFSSPCRFTQALGSPNIFEPGCAQCFLPRMATFSLMYGGSKSGTTSMADSKYGGCSSLYFPEDNPIQTLVMWGTCTSYHAPSGSGRAIAELRAREQGLNMVVVDPRFTPDAAMADVWLPIRPGTDVALMMTWIRYIIENKLYDEDFCKRWTNLPYLIDTDTKKMLRAYEVGLGEADAEDAEKTFVVWDQKTNSAKALPWPYDEALDPAFFGTYEIDGKQYPTGGQLLKESVDEFTLAKAAEICWLDEGQIEKALEIYTTGQSGIMQGVPIDQYEQSQQCALGALNLEYLMGNVQKPGAMLQSFKPCPARDQIPNTPRFLHKDKMLKRLGVQEHKGLLDWDMAFIPAVFKAMKDGDPYQIHAWFERSGNKHVVLGNATCLDEIVPNLDFVCHIFMYPTAFSVLCADMLLPSAEWLETNLVIPQLNAIVIRQAVTHLFETVEEGLIWTQIVQKMAEMGNVHAQEAFTAEGTNGIPMYKNEYEKQKLHLNNLKMSWEEAAEKGVFEWCTEEEYRTYYGYKAVDEATGKEKGFGTPSKKCEVYCESNTILGRTGFPWSQCFEEKNLVLEPASKDYEPLCYYKEPAESPLTDTEYPLVLTEGRLPMYHHGTLRNIPYLREIYPVPEMWIHPDDAATYGVEDGQWCTIASRRGETHGKARVTTAIAKGVIYQERFWNPECYDESQTNPTAGWRECNVNVLTKNDAPFNEVYGSYTNRGFTVKIEKSQKPANVWVEPEEFAPFLPTEEMLSEAQTKDVF